MTAIEQAVDQARAIERGHRLHLALLAVILCIGAFARLWEFGAHPAGLHQDEASIGYEAHNLLRYGVDRAGNTYPVHLVAWGSGQNAAYAYMAMPFVAVLGLTPVSIRLPMVVAGLASLLLFYYIASRLFGTSVGLFAAFLLAASPWHIMMSRWALESNLLPFWFLCGLACIVAATRTRRSQMAWMIAAGVCFAACLYSYGTAYLSVPIFVVSCIAALLLARAVRPVAAAGMALVFIVLSAPMAMFVLINTFRLTSVQLGPVTIPVMPGMARHVQMSILASSTPLELLRANADMFFNLLKDERDGTLANTLPPYGVLFGVLLPLAIGGLAVVIWAAIRSLKRPDRCLVGYPLVLAWLLAALTVGVVGSMNINRANLIFLPLLLLAAIFIVAVDARVRGIALSAALAFLGAFILFTDDYHSQGFKDRLAAEYQPGYVDALRFASQSSSGGICVQAGDGLRYVQALFADPVDPRQFAASAVYDDPSGAFRDVLRYGRYTFTGCDPAAQDAYVTSVHGDPPPLPAGATAWAQQEFGPYRVYIAQR